MCSNELIKIEDFFRGENDDRKIFLNLLYIK